jgi:MFS family permease
VFALLPKLQEAHDLPTASLGLIGGISVMMSVTAQLTLARYADRGHTILMLRLGIVSIVAGFAWMGFAQELWHFVAARALTGLGTGIFTPAARRVIVAQDPARAGELLGRMTAADVAGFVVGPPLAVTLNHALGLQAPFLIPAVLMAVTIVFVRSITEPPPLARRAGEGVRSLLRLPAVRASLVIGATVYLSVGAFEPIIAKQLTDLGAGDGLIALTLSLFAVPYVFFTGYGGRLADRHGPHRTAVISLVCTVPVVAAFGLVNAAFLIAVFGVIRSTCDSVTTPAGISAMARSSPPAQLATGQGLYGAVSQSMAGAAALLGAPLYAWSGARALWFVVAGLVAVLTLWAALLAVRAGVWQGMPSLAPSPVASDASTA